jgi:hypothetical protein
MLRQRDSEITDRDRDRGETAAQELTPGFFNTPSPGKGEESEEEREGGGRGGGERERERKEKRKGGRNRDPER